MNVGIYECRNVGMQEGRKWEFGNVGMQECMNLGMY